MSLALKNLRTKYDDIHKMTVEKEHDLELIDKAVKKITEEERQVEKMTGGSMIATHAAEAELERVKYDHESQQLNNMMCVHMLKRMKHDLIALQLNSNDLIESLHSKNQIYKEDSVKHRLAKEHKLQSKYRLDTLMKNIDHE